MTTTSTTTAELSSSAWSPLRHSVFRSLWIAGLVSDFGAWMHEVGEAWLMTSLSPSPLLVALLQAADSLAIFLFSLPDGALADLVDRRRLAIFTQVWMLVAALSLGLLTLSGGMTSWILIGLSFVMSIGVAMDAPVWQAIVPEVVPRGELPQAVALGGISINLARAVAPALGGLVVERVRRRNGAYQWQLFQDPSVSDRFVETYMTDSWADHLRQHARVTVEERDAESRLTALAVAGTKPVVTHMIAVAS